MVIAGNELSYNFKSYGYFIIFNSRFCDTF